MDRIAFIDLLADQSKYRETFGLIYALVRCLPPEDAVLLLNTLGIPRSARTAAIRKICDDIVSGKLANPLPAIEALMSRIESSEHRHRESAAYCLLEIAKACDGPLQRRVQAYLGTSGYVGLRRRSYKLYDMKSKTSCRLLERAWRTYRDSEAAWAITKTFPAAFLLAEKDALLESLTEGWQLSRLYLRIATIAPEAVDELCALDPISYVYVMAKRGVIPSADIIRKILDRSLGDERFGLLLWSLGELGQWDVLVSVSERLEAAR